jgi:hypothetical protein
VASESEHADAVIRPVRRLIGLRQIAAGDGVTRARKAC